VERQAAHENLIREMANLLREAFDDHGVRCIMGDFWNIETRQILEKIDA
jgi:hypothetical protein